MSKNLVMVTANFPPETGGMQTYAWELAKRFSEFADNFVVISIPYKDAEQFDLTLNFKVVRIGSDNTLGWHLPAALKKLAWRPDIVFHVQWTTAIRGNYINKTKLAGRQVIAAHARELLINPLPNLLKPAYNALRKKSLSAGQIFLPVSHFAKDLLKQLDIHGKSVKVVSNGSDPKQFFPISVDQFRKEKGFLSDKIILTVSRLAPRKGIDTVIQAMPSILNQFSDAQYIIVGEGPDKSRLQSIAMDLNVTKAVHFIGRVPYKELNKWYNLGDIFALPARAAGADVEGFGIVFLEANSCNKPVIGARSGGIPDAVLHEETGLLVEPDDVPAFSAAAIRLLSDPHLAKRLGKTGRNRVETTANWQSVSEKIWHIITI